MSKSEITQRLETARDVALGVIQHHSRELESAIRDACFNEAEFLLDDMLGYVDCLEVMVHNPYISDGEAIEALLAKRKERNDAKRRVIMMRKGKQS